MHNRFRRNVHVPEVEILEPNARTKPSPSRLQTPQFRLDFLGAHNDEWWVNVIITIFCNQIDEVSTNIQFLLVTADLLL
jgi:hypothetical protein